MAVLPVCLVASQGERTHPTPPWLASLPRLGSVAAKKAKAGDWENPYIRTEPSHPNESRER